MPVSHSFKVVAFQLLNHSTPKAEPNTVILYSLNYSHVEDIVIPDIQQAFGLSVDQRITFCDSLGSFVVPSFSSLEGDEWITVHVDVSDMETQHQAIAAGQRVKTMSIPRVIYLGEEKSNDAESQKDCGFSREPHNDEGKKKADDGGAHSQDDQANSEQKDSMDVDDASSSVYSQDENQCDYQVMELDITTNTQTTICSMPVAQPPSTVPSVPSSPDLVILRLAPSWKSHGTRLPINIWEDQWGTSPGPTPQRRVSEIVKEFEALKDQKQKR
jgi:hypothetical protein